MDSELVKRLLQVNREFYLRFSEDFSESRSSERLNIEPFRRYLSNDIRLLDVGCGNGRLAKTCDRAGYALDYLGIDGSAELVAHAVANCTALSHVRAQFRVMDLTAPHWSATIGDGVAFDVIVSLAV